MKFEPNRLLLYAVTDRAWLSPGETLEEPVEQILQNGATLLQLREKALSPEAFLAQAQRLLPICRRHGVPLIINDDPQIALLAGADGVHVGQSDASVAAARKLLGPEAIIGASAHSVAEALEAQAAGANYLGCGAVFSTATKSDAGSLPLSELAEICRTVSIPVVAIGGIGMQNLPLLAGSGAAGVAVVSALFAAPDKARAARELHALARRTLYQEEVE